ncbi:MAG TPA: hypothetical protein VLE99_06005 [Candidatus Saccharimonadales bacterium]|nr:hypothetical protein [Candidatus Saccharimonadales bacterium]
MAKIQSLTSTTSKETIYVDVDDEITSIIDKVQSAKGKVVALVLPKRAPVLQSIVNMKLLKRTADTAEKNLVLVTSETGLMPLAGAVGLHVASTPTSKPSVPSAPTGPGDEPEDADEPLNIVDGTSGEAEGEDFDPKTAAGKTVGELTATDAASKVVNDDVDESIDMEDEAEASADDGAVVPPPKKNKKLKVPNFDSFRTKLMLAILGLAVLVTAWIFAFNILPKATITIHTDSSTITTNLNLTLDTTAKALDATSNVVPATAQTQQKTSTQQASATGQQNNGAKATGNVTMSAKVCGTPSTPADVPTGTSLSAGGHTYIAQSNTSFNFDHISGGCIFFKTSSATPVQALKGGADYNTDSTSFSVSGRSDISATGSADGGTDDIVKVVQQSDIDGATAKISTADSSSVKQQLISNLESKGLIAVPTTFVAGTPQVTTSAKAGDPADTVTVTAVTTYTMFGVQKTDLQTLVDGTVNGQLDKGKQVILDDGVADASFSEPSPPGATGASVSMQTKSLAGPQLNTKTLRTQLAGKKSGDVKAQIKQTPGVTAVDVHFSPFWVSIVPKNINKVTIQIVKDGK